MSDAPLLPPSVSFPLALAAAGALAASAGTAEAAALPRVQAAVERLSAGLLDHLEYEEAELLPALGRLGVRV